MKAYKDRWFNVNVCETIVRAKCLDIEFEGGLGPMFLMETSAGFKFWVNRKELNEYANIS